MKQKSESTVLIDLFLAIETGKILTFSQNNNLKYRDLGNMTLPKEALKS